jgi:hypothetical protein
MEGDHFFSHVPQALPVVHDFTFSRIRCALHIQGVGQ